MRAVFVMLAVCPALVALLPRTVAAQPAADPPADAPGYIARGVERFGEGEFDRAIADFTEALRLDPDNAHAFAARRTAWFRKKEYDKAVGDFDQSIRLVPDQPWAGHHVRGSAHYMRRAYSEAIKDFEAAIKLNPKEVEALNGLAWAAAVCSDAKFRDDKKAVENAERACRLDGHKNPFFVGTLAAAYAAGGRFDEAVKSQKKALADPVYRKESGDEGRAMLRLFERGMPYREKLPDKS